MRNTILIFIVIGTLSLEGQDTTTTTPTTPPGTPRSTYRQNYPTTPPQTPPDNVPRDINSGNEPPGRAFNPTNPPPGRPFRSLTNGFTPGISNPPAFNGTNGNTFQAGSTNRVTFSNGMAEASSSGTVGASITNTLSTMAPAQANNVIQVQAGLNALQQVVVSLGGVQNLQQIIQQNPQVQVQLQKVEAQISALGQGTIRPSQDIVVRLSEDLLRVNAVARLSPDQQLVIAIVINQACNSGRMSAAQIESSINVALSNFERAGAPRAFIHPIGCDLHSVAFELQPNLGM